MSKKAQATLNAHAIDAASNWLDVVGPQIGDTANFAQVDLDTLMQLDRRLQKNLANLAVTMFDHLTGQPAVIENRWFFCLTVPLDSTSRASKIKPNDDAAEVLARASFTGSLLGRRLPGLFLANWVPEYERGPVMHSLIPLSDTSQPSRDVHYREAAWLDPDTGKQDGEPERSLEYRHYPPQVVPHEAKFGPPLRVTDSVTDPRPQH
jgi:hypothetical protein